MGKILEKSKLNNINNQVQVVVGSSEVDCFEDLLDQGRLEELESNNIPENISDSEYSRFRRIPIGTFWNSQRNKTRTKKKPNLQKAIKKVPNNSQILQSTLIESRRKGSKSHLQSPILVATHTLDPELESEDFPDIVQLPPPLLL